MGSIDLPKHVAGIVVAADVVAGNGAELKHGFRAVNDEPGMHLDRDFYAVVAGEFSVLGPVRRDLLFPLPIEDIKILRGPRTGHPIRVFRIIAIAWTTGKINHDRNAEFRGKFHCPPAGVGIVLSRRPDPGCRGFP